MNNTLPRLIPVKSSNISRIGYDKKIEKLYVEFVNSSLYSYSNVEKDIFDNLMASESKGRYFQQNIKNIYDFERVSQ